MQFLFLLNLLNPDIILLNETKLNDDDFDDMPPGYAVFLCNRSDGSPYGGSAILINKNNPKLSVKNTYRGKDLHGEWLALHVEMSKGNEAIDHHDPLSKSVHSEQSGLTNRNQTMSFVGTQTQ